MGETGRGSIDPAETAWTRRHLLQRGGGLVAAGSFLPLLVACGDDDDGSGKKGTANFELWTWQAPGGNGYDKVFAAAGARLSTSDQKVKYKASTIEYAAYVTKLKTSIAGGEPPVIAQMPPTGDYRALVDANSLEPLTADLQEGFPEFFPSTIDSLRYKDEIWAIPLDLNNLMVAYNKQAFEKAGVEPPSTLDDFIALAGPLREAGYEPFALPAKDTWICGDVWFQGCAYSDPTDEAIRNAELGELAWTSEPFVQAAEYAQRIAASDLPADGYRSLGYEQGITAFGTGKAAMMYPIGNFSLLGLDTAIKDKFEYGLFPLPPLSTDQQPRATGGPAILFSVPKGSKHKDLAVEFMRLATDKKGQEELIERDFIPASPADVGSNDNPIFKQMLEVQETAATRVLFLPEVYAALLNGMQAVLTKGSSPEDLVNSLAKA